MVASVGAAGCGSITSALTRSSSMFSRNRPASSVRGRRDLFAPWSYSRLVDDDAGMFSHRQHPLADHLHLLGGECDGGAHGMGNLLLLDQDGGLGLVGGRQQQGPGRRPGKDRHGRQQQPRTCAAFRACRCNPAAFYVSSSSQYGQFLCGLATRRACRLPDRPRYTELESAHRPGRSLLRFWS